MPLFGTLLTYPAAYHVEVLKEEIMQEEIKKLFIRIANAGKISEEELETLNKNLGGMVASVSKEFKEYKERPWYKKIFAK